VQRCQTASSTDRLQTCYNSGALHLSSHRPEIHLLLHRFPLQLHFNLQITTTWPGKCADFGPENRIVVFPVQLPKEVISSVLRNLFRYSEDTLFQGIDPEQESHIDDIRCSGEYVGRQLEIKNASLRQQPSGNGERNACIPDLVEVIDRDVVIPLITGSRRRVLRAVIKSIHCKVDPNVSVGESVDTTGFANSGVESACSLLRFTAC
jgi:hypothetical protein